MSCPIGKEWDTFVEQLEERNDKLSFADALTAYDIFNSENNTVDIIPSIEEALQILNNLTVIEKDEQLAKLSEISKKEQFVKQQELLSDVYTAYANTKQQETLDKIVEMTNNHIAFIDKNIESYESNQPYTKTISVSKFIGASDFKGDAAEYEAFKLFGTFVHTILEDLQIQALDKGNVPVSKIFNQKYFNTLLAEYRSKNPFEIQSLDDKKLFLMTKDLVEHIAALKRSGHLILPEISVIGTDLYGTKIIGRIDMLLIDKTGAVKIYDFKTKKVQLLDVGADWQSDNADEALNYLALKTHTMAMQPGTQIALVEGEFKRRSTYDTWAMQVNVYKNILQQSDVPVSGHTILSLLYETDTDKNFLGSIIHEFQLENYYLYADTTSDIDENGISISKRLGFDTKIDKIKSIIGKFVPTGKVSTADDVKTTTLIDEEIDPTDEEYATMRSNIQMLIDKELASLLGKRNDPKTTIGEKKILAEKIEMLRKYKELIPKMDNADFDKSINFAKVMDYLYEEMSFSNTKALELLEKYESDPAKFTALDYKKMALIFNNAQSLNDIINIMNRSLNEAINNEQNAITLNSPVVNRLGSILNFKESIRNAKSKVNKKYAAQVLMTPGKKAFNRIDEQLQELLSKEIEILEKEILELQAGKGLTLAQTLRSKVLEAISSSYRNNLEAKLGENAPKLALIEEKEKQIKILSDLINGTFDFSEGNVLTYLDNITNPDSTFYVGSDRVFPYTQIISGLKMKDWIAPASDKDLATSSITQFYKNAAALAVANAQNEFASSNFDKLREELYRSGRSFEKINQQITEKRTVRFRDPNTKELVEKDILSFVKPYSQEYEDKWNNQKTLIRQFDYELRVLKYERNQIFDKKQDATEITQKIKDKENERKESIVAHNNWMIQNCSLPYVDEFYKLQRDLPTEIADQIQDLYLELEQINFFADMKRKEDDVDIEDPFDFDRIGEIEDEIRVLREKAKEISPAYADYISRINEFYEFDVNQNYYNRQLNHAMAKYEGNPEGMEQWMKENTVTRPKAEWYETLNNLYDQLSDIYGDDPVLKDLIDERNKILRPHKVAGVLQSQYLNDEEIEKYDAVQEEISEYMANKAKVSLDDFTRDRANEIFAEINAIKETAKSKYYENEFETRYTNLENKLLLVNEQKSYIASLSTKGATQEELDVEKKKLVKLEIQFGQTESDFRKWYNKNHTNKYKSIQTGFKIRSFSMPKAFNFQTLPAEAVKSKYMETIPHPKYNKKRMRRDKYIVDGEILNDEDAESLLRDPETLERLNNEGRLNIDKGVFNPNFLLSPDGIPMPKNIIKVDENVYAPIPGKGFDNINQKYLDLYNDPKLFEFYAALTSMFFSLQKRTDGKVLGYNVPGFVSTVTESLYTSGLSEAIKKQKDIFVDKNIKSYGSAQDLNDNLFGDLGNSIRLRGNNQLSELLQSTDAVSSAMQWAAEAHYNIAMQEASPVVDAFVDELKAKALELQEKIQKGDKGIVRDIDGNIISAIDFAKRLNELNGVISIAEYEKRKFVNGQYEDPNAASRKITKNLNNFFRYTSFIRIGFDVANQTKNYVAGSVQSLIAACDFDSGHYGKKDYLWAKGHIFGFNGVIAHYIKDLGNISDISESTMIYRLFNPTQKEFGKYVKDMSGKVSRKVLGKVLNLNELGFFLQDKGDTLIGMTVLWSVLNNYKFRVIKGYDSENRPIFEKDADGNDVYIPGHECYIKNPSNNNLEIRKDVEYTKEDENFIRNIVYSEMRRAQGNYAKADQVKAESTVQGKMMLFFRKYLIPMFMNRFGYMKTNWEAGEVSLGYWRAVGTAWRQFGGLQVAKHMLVGGKTLDKFHSNTMGKFLTGKVNQARRDAMAIIILSVLSSMALAYVKRKDDEDEELSMIEGNLIRLLWQVKGETASMLPVGEGSTEYVRNFTTGVPLVREFTAGIKLVNHSYSYVAAMAANGGIEPDEAIDSQWYQETWKNAFYARKAGAYEKGDPKIMKDFVDLTGVRNFRDLLDPNFRIDLLKRNQ